MEIQKTALRLPKDLHTDILQAASESGRSMNAEIVRRLQASFNQIDTNSSESLDTMRKIAKEEARQVILEELKKKK